MRTKETNKEWVKNREITMCIQQARKQVKYPKSYTKMNDWNGKQTESVMALFYVVLNW